MDKQYVVIHTMDDVMICATTWVNLENMLNEKSQSQKSTYESIQKKVLRDRKLICGLLGQGGKGRQGGDNRRGVIAKGWGLSF